MNTKTSIILYIIGAITLFIGAWFITLPLWIMASILLYKIAKTKEKQEDRP